MGSSDPLTFSEVIKLNTTGEKILSELKEGKDFKALAKKYSDDLSSRNDGGNAGWVMPGDYQDEPAVLEVINSLEKGSTSGLIDGSAGFYIVKITDIKRKGYIPYEMTIVNIKRIIMAESRQIELDRLLRKIVAGAVIEKKSQAVSWFRLF